MMKNLTPVSETRGRPTPEENETVRNPFQRDVDRIMHSKSFRRLVHKTQVFLNPEGDHYRTRLTHTLEVSRIARTISRALGLNEDLTEAIAVGHDLGHTPFGHAGERALAEILRGRSTVGTDFGGIEIAGQMSRDESRARNDEWLAFGEPLSTHSRDNDGRITATQFDPSQRVSVGFSHNEQSLRVVDCIEKNGRGLNLTHETRDGILWHTGAEQPSTFEGRVVRLSDRVAYLNHDLDDALRAGILGKSDIPDEVTCAFGVTTSQRINTIVCDIVAASAELGDIAISSELSLAFDGFYAFMFDAVYRNPVAKAEESKVFGVLEAIFDYFAANADKLPEEYRVIAEKDGLHRAVADYVSGMTDSYAVAVYERLFVPSAWR